MTSVNKQSNAKDTKADEVCTNKCPNKKHIHNRMIQSNAIQKQLNLEKLKSSLYYFDKRQKVNVVVNEYRITSSQVQLTFSQDISLQAEILLVASRYFFSL